MCLAEQRARRGVMLGENIRIRGTFPLCKSQRGAGEPRARLAAPCLLQEPASVSDIHSFWVNYLLHF